MQQQVQYTPLFVPSMQLPVSAEDQRKFSAAVAVDNALIEVLLRVLLYLYGGAYAIYHFALFYNEVLTFALIVLMKNNSLALLFLGCFGLKYLCAYVIWNCLKNHESMWANKDHTLLYLAGIFCFVTLVGILVMCYFLLKTFPSNGTDYDIYGMAICCFLAGAYLLYLASTTPTSLIQYLNLDGQKREPEAPTKEESAAKYVPQMPICYYIPQ